MTRIEAYRVALKMPFPAATGTLTLYVAFSHFSRSYLEKLWSQQVNTHRISWTMPAEQGRGHGFTDRVPHSNDDVYILPNVTLEVTDRVLEELETKRAATKRKGTKAHRRRGRHSLLSHCSCSGSGHEPIRDEPASSQPVIIASRTQR